MSRLSFLIISHSNELGLSGLTICHPSSSALGSPEGGREAGVIQCHKPCTHTPHSSQTISHHHVLR